MNIPCNTLKGICESYTILPIPTLPQQAAGAENNLNVSFCTHCTVVLICNVLYVSLIAPNSDKKLHQMKLTLCTDWLSLNF